MVIVESEAVLIHGWSDYIVITAGGLICCWVHAEGRGLRSRLGCLTLRRRVDAEIILENSIFGI